MASLNSLVRANYDILKDGIAWVAFWKEGRSWNAEYFHLETGVYLSPVDRIRMEEIKQTDPAAVVVNGYYSGYLGKDMNLDKLTAKVRCHYENGYSNIEEFIEAHEEFIESHNDRLSPEEIAKGRETAHLAGLPFSEKPYRSEEVFDPYVYDGTMSIEDYKLMQNMVKKEVIGQTEEPMHESLIVTESIPLSKNDAKVDNRSPAKDFTLGGSALPEKNCFNRGSVWLMELSKTSGSVQYGKRPVVIIQNNILNVHSPTVLIAPLTSKDKKFSKAHVSVDAVWLKLPSLVLLEQITVVDKLRLKRCVGTFDDDTMERIDRAVNWCLAT